MDGVKGPFPTLEALLQTTMSDFILKPNWPSLISGVYFIIRSLDNIGKGLKRDKIRAELFNRRQEERQPGRIKQEAYHLWQVSGCPEGTEEVNWAQAKKNCLFPEKHKTTLLANIWAKIFGFD